MKIQLFPIRSIHAMDNQFADKNNNSERHMESVKYEEKLKLLQSNYSFHCVSLIIPIIFSCTQIDAVYESSECYIKLLNSIVHQ